MTKDKLSKSCGEGRLYDCLSLGEIYYKEKQYSKARKHFEVQCDLDGNDENEEYANNNGCYYMGKMSALGQGTDKNLFQAEKYFDKACSYGDPRDDYCDNVVSLYERGDEVIGITPKGKRYYYYVEKFCNPPSAYNGDICAELVNLYENGEETLGIAKDSQKVLYYFGILCEGYGIDFFATKSSLRTKNPAQTVMENLATNSINFIKIGIKRKNSYTKRVIPNMGGFV